MFELGDAAHDQWLAAEGDRLLEFGRAARHPEGGFAWLDDDGAPELDRPVELWITCRMTHVYSLGHLLGRSGCDELADHGVAALRDRFRDHQHGGWYAKVGAEGPTTTDKTAYEHAFVVLAAASATAAGRPGGRELLDDALGVLLEHFWDDDFGMVVEQWDESFSTLDPYRGVNANMHTVEALLSAADVLDDPGLRDRALRILTRVVHELAASHEWRIPEHFDESWTPILEYNLEAPADPFRPYGATIGHWLEWARLALHLRAGTGRRSTRLAPRRRAFAVRRIRARGLGSGRRGRVRLHRRLVRPARRTPADALGRGRGHRGGRSPARGDRRLVVRELVPARGGSTSTPASATPSTAPGTTSSRRPTNRAASPGRESRTPTTPSRQP